MNIRDININIYININININITIIIEIIYLNTNSYNLYFMRFTTKNISNASIRGWNTFWIFKSFIKSIVIFL